ncbi:MAG: serine/threonine protein kinase [Myxococcota bacterium]
MAVKIARPRLTEAQLAGLRAEFGAAAVVAHPSVVDVITQGETDDQGTAPALVMEYVEGERLDTFLEREAPLSAPMLDALFGPLTQALQALHGAGVIHRDVSPANIILSKHEAGPLRPKLIDFGLAARVEAVRDTQPGAIGTPRYCAPEQIRGKSEIRSDMYSLGAILWWALTGYPRLSAFSTAGEIINHQLGRDDLEDPRTVRESVPYALAQLTTQLLNPYPAGRPSATSMLKRWPQAVQSLRAAQNHPQSIRRRGRRLTKTSGFDVDAVDTRTMVPSLPSRKQRVLLVSSDHIDLSFLEDHLDGFDVDIALNSARAFLTLRRGKYDAAIIAVAERTYDGHHLVEALREREGAAAMTLLLASERPDPGRLWARVGADALIELSGHLPEIGGLLDSLIDARGRTRPSR